MIDYARLILFAEQYYSCDEIRRLTFAIYYLLFTNYYFFFVSVSISVHLRPLPFTIYYLLLIISLNSLCALWPDVKLFFKIQFCKLFEVFFCGFVVCLCGLYLGIE